MKKITRRELRQIINESLSESLNEGFFDGVKSFFGFGGQQEAGESAEESTGDNVHTFVVRLPIERHVPYDPHRSYAARERAAMGKKALGAMQSDYGESEQEQALQSISVLLSDPRSLDKVNKVIYEYTQGYSGPSPKGLYMPNITRVQRGTGDTFLISCDLSKDPAAKNYLGNYEKYKYEDFKHVVSAKNSRNSTGADPDLGLTYDKLEDIFLIDLFFYRLKPLNRVINK